MQSFSGEVHGDEHGTAPHTGEVCSTRHCHTWRGRRRRRHACHDASDGAEWHVLTLTTNTSTLRGPSLGVRAKCSVTAPWKKLTSNWAEPRGWRDEGSGATRRASSVTGHVPAATTRRACQRRRLSAVVTEAVPPTLKVR
jgi:hypothetical protein